MTQENINIKENSDARLIKNLEEKQRMIDKYESMLKKVNIEFQNTLTINRELSDENSLLHLKLQKAEEKVTEVEDNISGNINTIQRQLDEMILEKDELQNDNISLNKLIKNKNFEIDELRKYKNELEHKVCNITSNSNKQSEDIDHRTIIEELQNKISELEIELRYKSDIELSDSTNSHLIIQSLRNDVEILKSSKNDLNQQIIKQKEQTWKDSLNIKHLTNENENLKRENSNLKNTIELVHENEKDVKTENKYLRDSLLMHERKCILYQNIITQNDALDINVIQSLERTLYLLRSSDEINKGLSLVNIEKLIDEIRGFRFKVKAKIEASTASLVSFRPSSTQSEYRFNLNNISYDNISVPVSEIRTERSNTKDDCEFNQGDQTGSISRSAKRIERLDPSKMQPAGIKSNKAKTFSSKHQSQYICEIGNLKDLSS